MVEKKHNQQEKRFVDTPPFPWYNENVATEIRKEIFL